MNQTAHEITAVTFTAVNRALAGNRPRKPWSVRMDSGQIVFSDGVKPELVFSRKNAARHILFLGDSRLKGEPVIEVAKGLRRLRFTLPRDRYHALYQWTPGKSAQVFARDLRILGISLAVISILAMIFNKAVPYYVNLPALPAGVLGVLLPGKKPILLLAGAAFIYLGLVDCYCAYWVPEVTPHLRWVIPILWGSLKISDYFWFRHAE
ncbi:hypothetical protein JW905_18635 [bacterium]|nr:hypothetical protein [candidate division CSSED10-310 bacterium]